MKKSIVISILGGLMAAAPVMAANYDMYVTGSTAFRPNVFSAISKIFDGGTPSSSNKGTGVAPTGSDNQWTMIGTCTNLGVTSGSDTLTIHALFTGSVQGISSMLNKDQLVFFKNATLGDTTLVTNTASIAFSDVYSKPALYHLPTDGSFAEDDVAVQPFAFFRSTGLGDLQNLANITAQQLYAFLQPGMLPLSYLDGNMNDYGTNVYMIHRTLDSGTRVTTVQESKWNGSIAIRYYNPGGDNFITATTNRGPAQFGPGYVGGSDLRAALQTATAGGQSIGYLSFADGRTVTGVNWQNMLAYNGVYPIVNWTPGSSWTAATNDFTPVTSGKYSFWATEVLDHPATSAEWNTFLAAGQNLSFSQINALIGRLEATYSGSGTLNGSIDYEIELSKTTSPNWATAIRLNDMQVTRQSVGGVIAPN
jgi:hypothetical protein